jgi:hypothetical protein
VNRLSGVDELTNKFQPSSFSGIDEMLAVLFTRAIKSHGIGGATCRDEKHRHVLFLTRMTQSAVKVPQPHDGPTVILGERHSFDYSAGLVRVQ